MKSKRKNFLEELKSLKNKRKYKKKHKLGLIKESLDTRVFRIMGPTKCFPVVTVNNILKDVVTSYLQEEKYEAELCRQMTKTISEVIKARVKDLMIPRYKIIVIIHIGQLQKQSMQIGSRCLWDTASDTFSTFSFKNRSLFALANVYAVYSE
ncbi:dynein light chain Tctex-type 5 isoform X2 [Hemicordylus capensis]|uniref:dynein light chain Tctex-type 5 isoform X2 n=1 Tax=Hemicordylus capensis TaxID=884348 RepID=UPI002303B6B9|nr:dynein light chain Tctex-type 5 isoform X2 [Hemicordylus capensis]